jgi:hypothetical protein
VLLFILESEFKNRLDKIGIISYIENNTAPHLRLVSATPPPHPTLKLKNELNKIDILQTNQYVTRHSKLRTETRS